MAGSSLGCGRDFSSRIAVDVIAVVDNPSRGSLFATSVETQFRLLRSRSVARWW